MTDELNSPHWHRVATRTLILHSHVDIHCHEYRGLNWYLLEDTSSGKNHRFNPAAYQFIVELMVKKRFSKFMICLLSF